MNLTWLKPIEQVPKHRQLGVTVDEQLKWQKQNCFQKKSDLHLSYFAEFTCCQVLDRNSLLLLLLLFCCFCFVVLFCS